MDSELIVEPEACGEIERLCCTAQEHTQWASAADRGLVVTLIFSAKEALYKAIYPLVRRFVDFHEVEVTALDWHRGMLTLCPLPGTDLGQRVGAVSCRFRLDEGMVHTSVQMPGRPLP